MGSVRLRQDGWEDGWCGTEDGGGGGVEMNSERNKLTRGWMVFS